jgi:hypothetical protein
MSMTATKGKDRGTRPDLSQEPTRKVDTMSSLAAEMLLQDADETAPGIPALSADRALARESGDGGRSKPSADASAAHADQAGLEMARLIEVRTSGVPELPRATSPAEESAMIRAFRPKGPRVLVVVVVALVVLAGAVAAAAFFFAT